MNNKLLKQQVDDFFSKSRSCQLTAWRQFKKHLKSEIISSNSPPNDIQSTKASPSKTSPIQKVQEYITKVFKPKSPEINISIEYLSEIPNKEDNPTISIKSAHISELLPVENILLIRDLLKVSTIEEDYLKELKKLAEDIERVSKNAISPSINN